MLTKSQKLDREHYQKTTTQSSVVASPLFSFRYKKGQEGFSRFSVTVSKKNAKTAILRNKIRRKVYAILKELYPSIQKGSWGIFYPNAHAITADTTTLTLEIKKLLKQAHIIA